MREGKKGKMASGFVLSDYFMVGFCIVSDQDLKSEFIYPPSSG